MKLSKQCIVSTNVKKNRTQLELTDINRCLTQHYNPKFWNSIPVLSALSYDSVYNERVWLYIHVLGTCGNENSQGGLLKS